MQQNTIQATDKIPHNIPLLSCVPAHLPARSTSGITEHRTSHRPSQAGGVPSHESSKEKQTQQTVSTRGQARRNPASLARPQCPALAPMQGRKENTGKDRIKTSERESNPCRCPMGPPICSAAKQIIPFQIVSCMHCKSYRRAKGTKKRKDLAR
ncbi:hypothetical protein VFPFJ_02377 [Purpureocillium lilacinum]|uniref:Uncharacterized protein n=1 Tax=Purpureocillium lilacinum TaxID=33203 RepID=A0A179HRZ1_PURLI|nr:hypothetical protein VFPFJ_02377 [Purpureocillium lilacinum]OAQ79030.1 hypothetical protein VFPBJ_07151 [Purpureocillium lilacinum]OAQ93216.1 hypothetical protein VFPFJ_02377 [Purpureocillium lilacinum]